MIQQLVTGAIAFTLTAVAQGQPWRGPGSGGPPGMERGGRGRGPAMMQRMSGRLADELGFSEDQRAELALIVEDFRAERDARRSEARTLFEEMQTATEAGDDARAAEVRSQLREMRRGRGEFVERFFDQVEPILTPDQTTRFAELREQARQRMERRGRGRMDLEALPDRLGLDETQRAQFDEMLSDFRTERRAHWEEMRPLVSEMRQARRDGDMARVDELRAELEGLRPAQHPIEGLLTELESILTEDQRAQLDQFRQSMRGRGRGRGGPDRTPSVREMLRALRRLDLSQDQRDGLREVEQAGLYQANQVGRRDRRGQRELSRVVKSEIVAVLTPEQVEEFERLLRDERPRRGRPRDGRGRGPRERWDDPIPEPGSTP